MWKRHVPIANLPTIVYKAGMIKSISILFRTLSVKTRTLIQTTLCALPAGISQFKAVDWKDLCQFRRRPVTPAVIAGILGIGGGTKPCQGRSTINISVRIASWLRVFCLVLLLIAPDRAFAEPLPFDLAGPKLEVNVTHAGKVLPISEVPNLSAGDHLSIKADFPPDQSVHYLLVAAFLRGTTNPPPENWFFSSETWNPKNRDGLKITVPQHAQQVIIFLAPETGGDFKTLVDAVRGRPGAFVRASQALNQATLDRSRLKVYLQRYSKD